MLSMKFKSDWHTDRWADRGCTVRSWKTEEMYARKSLDNNNSKVMENAFIQCLMRKKNKETTQQKLTAE